VKKLNLACGTDVRPAPWVNLDIVRQWPASPKPCDLIWDARAHKIPFPNNSVNEVKAGYLFLHVAPRHHEPLLKEIYRVMCPGGRLEVGEVDMDVTMRRWLADPMDKSANQMIWGEQGDDVPGNEDYEDFDKHCQGFTEGTLTAFLTRGGFTHVKRIKLHAVYYELTLECRK